MKKIGVVFLSILVCAIALAWLLITSENTQARELGKEIGKVTGQAIFAAIIGGIIVQEYNRLRERSAAINEFRKTILRNFIHSYVGAKKSRRLLRSRCRLCDGTEGSDSQLEISRLAYDEQLGSLSETQLELEILVHELNTFSEAFSKRNEIRRFIVKMESYLGTLITEYESSLRETKDAEFIKLDRLTRLNDFIHGRKDSFFRKNFTQSFHSALSLIQAERLGVK